MAKKARSGGTGGGGEKTGRFVMCPLSGSHHAPVALEVTKGPKGWPTVRCICKTRIFFPRDYEGPMDASEAHRASNGNVM